ncbi:MAG: LOG family protein [Candidatus Shapirobacteria bacterium]|jgi:hypothetical protein
MLSKTSKKIKRVAFFGDGTATEKDKYFIEAVETAKKLCQHKYIIVNGGGPGIMKAATLGAKKGGGQAEIVILNPKKEPDNYEGVDKENFDLANKIYTADTYQERTEKLIQIADAFVIFKGGAGTLSEMGMVWEYAKFNYGKHEPVIFYGDCWTKIVADLIRDLDLEKIEQRVVQVVTKPEEVVGVLRRIGGKY